MENEKKFLLRLPLAVYENLKKVNKYNLSVNKQINIIIFNYLKKALQTTPQEDKHMLDSMGRKRPAEAGTLSDEALNELIGDL